MGHNAFLPFQVYGTRLKFAFHDTEAFLNLPPAPVYFYDVFRPIFKTCAYRIKTIILFFLGNSFFINVINSLASLLAVSCGMVGFDKTLRVILPFSFHCFCASFYSFQGPFYLPVPDRTQIIAVLEGVGDDELLFQFHFFGDAVYRNHLLCSFL